MTSNHSNQVMKLEKIDEWRIVHLLKVYPLFEEIRVNIRKKITIMKKREKIQIFKAVLLNIFGILARIGSMHSGQAVIDNNIRSLNNLNN